MKIHDYIERKSIPEPNSGCFIWDGSYDKDGYGYASVKHKTIKAHRLVYSVLKGEIPLGMLVCHKCDNPSCVNPNHLFIGTALDNAIDRVKKGRGAKGKRSGLWGKDRKGIKNGRSKLTNEQVILIEKSEVKYSTLAELYEVHISTISAIKRHIRWSHLWQS